VQAYIKKDGDFIQEGIDYASELTAIQDHKAVLGKRFLDGEDPVQILQENPALFFELQKIENALTIWKKWQVPVLPRCSGFIPNSFGQILTVSACKQRHYWFWSESPNKGKTTFLKSNQDSLGNLLTTATLGSDFYFNEQVISWNQGEKIKYINININNDLFVENIEKIQLRIQPLINARISENSNNSMVLYIDSEDVPVSAYFRNDFIETYRPLYTNNPLPQNSPFQSLLNSIDDFISSTINVTISFSSPLPVDGEKIKIKYNNISTAKIGSDFGFDNLYSNVDEIELNVPLSSTSIDFNLFIKSHKGYIEDRLIILDLVQSTLGIIPVSLSPRNNFPQIKINIKDSTLPLFTRLSIPRANG
jgi:hypothetical protein